MENVKKIREKKLNIFKESEKTLDKENEKNSRDINQFMGME